MNPNALPGRRLGAYLSLLTCCLASHAADLSNLQVGVLRREVYTNVFGPHLTNLLNAAKFPNAPDEVSLVNSFEAPGFVGDMYGQRISGYLLPPYDGEYTFYLSSDDQGALYLSTDDNASNKVLIASEPTWSPPRSWISSPTRTNTANISAPIYLEQGRAYYVEALMKEMIGGDSLGVAWRVPGQLEPANGDWPIGGQYIAIENTPSISLPEALDYAGDFQTSSGAPWIGQSRVTMDGIDAAQAAAACCEYTSSMWLPVRGPARISFWYKIQTGGADIAQLGVWTSETGGVDSFEGDWDWQPYGLVVDDDATIYWVAYFENAKPGNGTGVWIDNVQVEPLTRPARELQEHPALATDGTDYLVVWMDRRHRESSWTEYDIFGARVSSTGEVLDPGGIPICTNRLWQCDPVVAFDGSNYLVVWSEIDASNEWNIRGARVSRDGAVLDPAGITICDQPSLQSNPAVVFNGSVYLVTWCDWRNMFYDGPTPLPATTAPDIYAARITRAGQVLDPSGFAVTREPYGQWGAHVTSLYNDFLVVWQDDMLRGARVTQQGTVSAPATLVQGSNSTPAGVGLSPGGFPMPAWLSWTEIRLKPDNTYLTDVFGTRINPSNSVAARVVLATNAGEIGNVTCDRSPASGFWSVWETRSGGPSSDIRGAWIPTYSSSGIPRPITVCTNAGTQDQPAIACNSNGCLVVWRDGRHLPPDIFPYEQPCDIYGSILTTTGTVLNASSFLVSSEVTQPIDPLIITWGTPTPITYGTQLSTDQLNARANIPGALTYSPPLYTMLKPGTHTLRAIFTPADLEHYGVTNLEVQLTVLRAPLLITVDDKARAVGHPNPRFTAHYAGLVWPDWYGSDLDTPVHFYTAADITSPVGEYSIVASGAEDPCYDITYENGILHVVPVPSGSGTFDVTFRSAPREEAIVYDIAHAAGGSFFIGGNFKDIGGVPRPNVARLLSDGTLDPNFRGPTTLFESVLRLLPQPDGKVVVASLFMDLPERTYGLARLNADGTPESGFDSPMIDETIITALALQTDGRILVGGWLTLENGFSGHAIIRLLAHGALDETWFVPVDGWISEIIVQPDGRILVTGAFSQVQDLETDGLARLLPDGSLDPAFRLNTDVTWPEAAELDNLGRILVSCHLDGESSGNGLYRFNADGTLDSSFTPLFPAWMTAIAVQPDGRIIAAGNFCDDSGVEQTAVIRLHSEGGIDTTFQAALAAGTEPYLADVAMEPSGKIIVGGLFNALAGISCNGLVRLNNDSPPPWVTRELPAAYLPQVAVPVQLTAEPPAHVSAYAIQDQPPAGWIVTNISGGGVFDAVTRMVKFGPYFDHAARSLSYVVFPPVGETGEKSFSGIGSANGVNTPNSGDATIQQGGPHPADTPPADFQLSIEEITAYAAAWRNGAGWETGPYPIPMDYVTRAAALWRAGECYVIDVNAPTSPLVWTECVPPSFIVTRGSMHRESTAVSAISHSIAPGKPIMVRITAVPGSGVIAYAVADQVPFGWSVENITPAGAYNPSTRTVKWGPFTDDVSRELRYSAVPSPTYAGPAHFNGAMSCDGTSTPVTGARLVTLGAQLRVCVSDSGCTIGLEATAGRTYVIETSTDLITWRTMAQVTGDHSDISTDQSAVAQFYRARLVD